MKRRGTFQDSDRYDRGVWPLESLGLRDLRRGLIATVPAGRVLEVGAGTGANLRYYRSGTHVLPTDRNRPMLEGLLRKYPHHRPLCADATRLPFADAAFDAVVSTLVFCSVSDPQRGLAELRRVLAPDGRLLMIEHVRGAGAVMRRLTDWLNPLWLALQGECHLNRETGRAVRQAGFTILRERRLAVGLLLVLEATAA